MNKKHFLYSASSEGSISVFGFNTHSGKLTFIDKITEISEVSSLCSDASRGFLFASIRNDTDIKLAASYKIDKLTGMISPINYVNVPGLRPVYISADRTKRFLFIANYNSGNFCVIKINNDGSLSDILQDIKIGENAHQIKIDPDNKLVFIPHLGSDFIAQFIFDGKTGSLKPNGIPFVKLDKGAGPRHIDFHPYKKILYSVNELNSTVSCFDIRSDGTLSCFQNTSTLPADYKGKNSTADIHAHPDGNFLYTSNRGHDSIAVYGIDKNRGSVNLTGIFKSGGIEPRNFTFDNEGNYIFAANRSSDNIAVFKINKKTGMPFDMPEIYNTKLPLSLHMISF